MLKEREREAVSLASQGKWAAAVSANQGILTQQPTNVEALNRLGKALSALGKYADARKALQQVLSLQPSNIIAKKNLERIQGLKDAAQSTTARPSGLAPRLFLEESGKTCITELTAPMSNLRTKVAPGDAVELGEVSRSPVVRIAGDGPLGRLNPKIAARLARLLKGGNKYEVAVSSVSDTRVAVLIRETYKHPSMVDVVSFPSSAEGVEYLDAVGDDLTEVDGEDASEEGEPEERDTSAEESGEEKATPTRSRAQRVPKAEDDDEDDDN